MLLLSNFTNWYLHTLIGTIRLAKFLRKVVLDVIIYFRIFYEGVLIYYIFFIEITLKTIYFLLFGGTTWGGLLHKRTCTLLNTSKILITNRKQRSCNLIAEYDLWQQKRWVFCETYYFLFILPPFFNAALIEVNRLAICQFIDQKIGRLLEQSSRHCFFYYFSIFSHKFMLNELE